MWAYDLNFRDGAYFLDFVNVNHKKISYTVSFGRTIHIMNKEEKEFIAPSLDRFDTLGVERIEE